MERFTDNLISLTKFYNSARVHDGNPVSNLSDDS